MAGPKKKKTPNKSSASEKAKTIRKRQKIKSAFEAGEIKDFADIFEVYMPETPFAKLIKMQKNQLTTKLKDREKFNFRDIRRISEAFEVDYDIVMNFIAGVVKAQYSESAGKVKST